MSYVIGFVAGAACAAVIPYVYDMGKWVAAKAKLAYIRIRAWLDYKAS